MPILYTRHQFFHEVSFLCMQEHPVPQNVTQFEFKLVGDMTIKQFGYLGGGLGLAYLTFVSMAAKLPFVAYPLMVIFALIGAALAFLPFQDRPLDHWMKAFLGAVMAPTKASFRSSMLATTDPAFDNRLKEFLREKEPSETPPPKPASWSLSAAQSAPATQTMVAPVMPVVQSVVTDQKPVEAQENKDLKQVVEYAEKAQTLQNQIVNAEKELEEIRTKASAPNQDPKVIAVQFQNVLTRLDGFNKQAKVMSDELARLTNSGGGVEIFQAQAVSSPTVRIQAKNLENYASLTSVANIINGVVYDANNNYLVGVIVVAHDKDNLPVRALKTNKLGQFLAATPLPNGTYTLTFEKDNLIFDTVEIELTGSILPALKVTAKKGI